MTSRVVQSSRSHPPWLTPILVAAVLDLSLIVYQVSWESLFDVWNERPGYSHGPLIVAVVAVLFFLHRNQLAARSPKPAPLMLAPLAAVSLLWLVAVLAHVQVVHQMLVPVIVGCAIFAVCGWEVARSLIVPVGYVITAVPLWDVFNPTLQAMTVGATESLLNVVGISSYIERNIVTLPNGIFEIAGGCSGLHFFVVGLSISVLYAHLYTTGKARFAAVLLLGLFFAIVANWLRVFIVIVAGYVTDMQHFLVTVDHYYFGWIVFILALFPFYFIARRLEASQGSDTASIADSRTSETPVRSCNRGCSDGHARNNDLSECAGKQCGAGRGPH